VTHLGQRLSALIDGELLGSERERVLMHMARCGSCRDEVAALRMLKRRLSAVGEAAAEAVLTGPAGAGLTGRLMSLSELMDLDDSKLSGGMPSGETIWPPRAPAGGWPMHERSGQPGQPEQAAKPADHENRPDQRAGRYFLAGSLVIFLAGLGTAAVIAGGEPQAQAPAPAVTPSVDVMVAPQNHAPPGFGNEAALFGPGPGHQWFQPELGATSLPGRR